MQNPEQAKGLVDALAATTVISTIMGWLPAVAALFTIVWTGFRINEEYYKWKVRRSKKRAYARRATDK